ncbi:GDP-mannose transporter [Astathelohania contejeani]|uniref:GDP-mannose transporter n=1 Tax=Astathelohania contejeani TaxID=164912 RepID=A0ABQ7HXQ2_9MICR|nr:GDP-mannose transporter [Thelohania contejeani]
MKKILSEKILLVSIYLLSSLITTLANKYILTNLKLKMPFFLLAAQTFFILLLSSTLCYTQQVTLKTFNFQSFFAWLPNAVLLTLMVYTGMKALYYLPISLFTLFKNGSIIFVALAERVLFQKKIYPSTVVSFALIMASSVVGESTELIINTLGLSWMLLNILSTSAYVIFLKYTIDSENTSDTESIFYCNAISLPLLAFFSFLLDTPDKRLIGESKYQIWVWIVISCISAFFTSYSTAWCLRLLSSTTLSMLGAINKLLVSISGIMFIGEENVSILKIGSLIAGTLGGLVYSKTIKKE